MERFYKTFPENPSTSVKVQHEEGSLGDEKSLSRYSYLLFHPYSCQCMV
jgi:sulfur relay (sulfurtransferase) DsrC/TusE family protein